MDLERDDSWIVISARRTGSKVITDIIQDAYTQKNIRLRYLSPSADVSTLHDYRTFIKHSHNPADLIHTYKYVVYSTRDPVESVLSWFIREKIVPWHLYSDRHTSLLSKGSDLIVPFYLPPDKFREQYLVVQSFYKDIRLPDHAQVVDYSAFRDNPANLHDILGLDKLPIKGKIPIKNPGEHKQWILNWDEIEAEINRLRL